MSRPTSILGCAGLLVATLCLAADRPQPDEAAQVFDAEKVHTLHLTVAPADWATLERSSPQGPRAPGPAIQAAGEGFTYVRADLECLGATCRSIGLRFKGNSSFRASTGSLKRPFKLDFNQFVKGQSFLGLTSLHLNINAMDPSAMREFLAYRLFAQASIPCSRVGYAKVYLTVPGKHDKQYLGLYTLVEDVNKTFAKGRLGSGDGLLMKAEFARELPYISDRWQDYGRCFEAKTEGNEALQARFIEFVQLIHRADDATFRAKIAEYLDMDEFLGFIAMNALLSNMDSYLCTGHNFCLYLDPKTRRIAWIPWDLNETFAGFQPAGSADEQIEQSIDHPCAGSNRLVDRLLAIPEYKRAYRQRIAGLMATTLKPEALLAMVKSTEQLIAGAIAEEIQAGVTAGRGPMERGRRPALDAFITRRSASVLAQLAGESEGRVLGGPRPAGPGMPMSSPLMRALDTDGDGELSAEEIRNSSNSLKKTDGRSGGRPGNDSVRSSSPAPSRQPAALTPGLPYTIVDTGQRAIFNDGGQLLSAPKPGEPFFGQDGFYSSAPPSCEVSADGLTVLDRNTGLTWQRSPDTNGDGVLDSADKLAWKQIEARPAVLNAARFGGYDDWRLPTIKELYSLIDFRGTDPGGNMTADPGTLTPFIDARCFHFAYGQVDRGERVIDSQYASGTRYVNGTPRGPGKLFGVNFADGRIKGYGLAMRDGREKTFFLQCVRGNPRYGINDFRDNADGTISDRATGLMWARNDSKKGMDWQEALAWVQARNAENYLGHNDWRLPTAKELHSIVDYTRSPDATRSGAIDALFACTAITNEASQADFPCYWTGTTHGSAGGRAAVYIAFGRAMGYMGGTWQDVHGAGSQRSDPKAGDPASFPRGRGPQGDAIRIQNYVRAVRNIDPKTVRLVEPDLTPLPQARTGAGPGEPEGARGGRP